LGEFLRKNPPDLGAFQRLGFAPDFSAFEEVKRYGLALVIVINGQNMLSSMNLQAEFLFDLSFQAGLEAFIFFLFAPRKLPEPCQVFALRALCKQEPPIPKNETGGDVKMGFMVFLFHGVAP
jgi:hypothetical protein